MFGFSIIFIWALFLLWSITISKKGSIINFINSMIGCQLDVRLMSALCYGCTGIVHGSHYKQVKVHRLCKVADLCLEFKLTRPSYSEANVKHFCKYKAWIQVLDTSMTQRQICKIQSMRIWSYNIEKISEIYCYNHKMYISSFFFSHWLSWLSNYTK